MTILGSSVTFSRDILDYPVLTGQALRYTVAALLLFGLSGSGVRLGGDPAVRRPGRRDLAVLVALAATGLAGFNVCVLVGLRHADTAIVGTAIGAAPLGLAIAAPLLRGARPAVRVVGAAGVIVLGIAVVHGGGTGDGVGLLAAFGAFVGEVLFSLLAAAVLPRLGAVRVSAWSCALAVPMLAVGALVTGESARWRWPTEVEALTLGYLATVLTVGAFLTWFTGLRRLGVDRAGLFVGVLPVATLVTTGLVDWRWPGPSQSIGVGLVAAGLAVGLLRGGRPRAVSPPVPASPPDPRPVAPIGSGRVA
jgi:drug/metabolite transporter (DMT)-like permease